MGIFNFYKIVKFFVSKKIFVCIGFLTIFLAMTSPSVASSIVDNSFVFSPFFLDSESLVTPSMLRVIQTEIFVSTSDRVVLKTYHDLEVAASTTSGSMVAALVGRLLNYPNPFRAYGNTLLIFELDQSVTLDLKIYDQFGNRIVAASIDAEPGVNRWTFNRDVAGGHLSAGVYYVLLLNRGKLFGKCKMVVIP